MEHFCLISKKQKMSSTNSQRPTPPSGRSISFRNSITYLFISVLLIYSVFSSRIIFLRNQNCPVTSSEISTKRNLETDTDGNYTSLMLSKKNESEEGGETELKHIVFGLAASSLLWDIRKEFIKVWWRPGETRGVVWLENEVKTSENSSLPEIRASEDASKFPMNHTNGMKSAIRISRVLSETYRLGMKDVRWFVLGDDDTFFVVDNLVRLLSNYDHNKFYYIGSVSESHIQNVKFTYAMAFGGGGIAVSYPLAKEFEKMQDRCIWRYPNLYGSDDRVQACMAELGVQLTREPGFHQFDIYGNALGILAAHPVTPFISIHHLQLLEPVFPDRDRVQSLQHLMHSARHDTASLMQQSICYDKRRFWSISVSWGYVVQIFRGIITPRELEWPARTYENWYPGADAFGFPFNTRSLTENPCQKPFFFYINSTKYDRKNNQIVGVYTPHKEPQPYCDWQMVSPETFESIVVMKTPDNNRWKKSRRRDCCRLMKGRRKATMYIWVKNCDEGEISEL